MERRYGRQAQRYRAKIEKKDKKASFEKIIARQGLVCALLLVAGICVSYLDTDSSGAGYIREVLYKSNTLTDWKDTVEPVLRTVKNSAKKTVSIINDGVEGFESKLGLNPKADNLPVKAKAEKTEKSDKKEETKNEDDITPQAQTKETKAVFKIPTNGEITSTFGSRVHPLSGNTHPHTGIDIAAPEGQTVISALAGTVTRTGYDDANGYYVVVKHSDEMTTVYAHLSKICVSENEVVDDNTKIGEVGSSGVSTGPHLHFEVKINQESVNPEDYITLKHRSEE